MKQVQTILLRWLPFAIVATIMSGLVFMAAQQVLRLNANDPQIELARSSAALLNNGQPADIFGAGANADIAKSLSPFMIIYDFNGKVINSTGVLGGVPPVPPMGVLQAAQAKGENRITWEPQSGVRIAAVIVPFKGKQTGFVLVGRSLSEVESRINIIMMYVFFGWLASLVASFILIALEPQTHRMHQS